MPRCPVADARLEQGEDVANRKRSAQIQVQKNKESSLYYLQPASASEQTARAITAAANCEVLAGRGCLQSIHFTLRMSQSDLDPRLRFPFLAIARSGCRFSA